LTEKLVGRFPSDLLIIRIGVLVFFPGGALYTNISVFISGYNMNSLSAFFCTLLNS